MKNRTILIALVIGSLASIGILRALANNDQSQAKNVVRQDIPHHAIERQDGANVLRADVQEHANMGATNQGIEGRVVDRRGSPVAGVEVVAMISDGRSEPGPLLKARTDKEGQFSIKGMPAGTYEVYVQQKDGPICPSCLFYSGGLRPDTITSATVVEGQVISNILLQNPPKSAKITGRISDGLTDEPVSSRITLRRADNPSYYLETGTDEKGNFAIAMPLAPVTMEVESPGYGRWNYVRDDVPRGRADANSLKLNPGEARKLEVRLRKKTP
jgi:hypothetical protein